MIRKSLRRFWFASLIAVAGGVLAIAFCHYSVTDAASDRVFEAANDVPKRKAAVVMGCARILPDGRQNLYFIRRIEAAWRLFDAGKCEYLIVSGDNSRESYDEPTDMRDALIAKGIPGDRIYRDYAGFRTLDSVVRAREIFGQEDFIVVSQEFHNERAIFIAKEHGWDNVVGYNARRVSSFGGLRTRLREYLARVKTVLDVSVLDTKPKFLGRSVELGGPVT